jgi:acetyl-CoA carboxylase carboxyltransferase component
VFIVSWPTGEFGGMGLEGYVQLAFRRELDAIADPVERRAEYERLVAERYDRGRALSMAEHFEIDDVIDPAASRAWIVSGLIALPPRDRSGAHKPRPNLDAW